MAHSASLNSWWEIWNFDKDLSKSVIMVKAKVLRNLQLPRDVIVEAIANNAELNEDTTNALQRGS